MCEKKESVYENLKSKECRIFAYTKVIHLQRHQWSKWALITLYLFINFMSLVTHEAPLWLSPNWEILHIWPFQMSQNCYVRLLQRFFLSSVASNWWPMNPGPGENVHKKVFHSLWCLLGILLYNKNWNFYVFNAVENLFEKIVELLEVIIMQLTWTDLIAPDVLLGRNWKFNLVL